MQAAIKLKYVFVNANQCNGSKKKLNALQNNVSLYTLSKDSDIHILLGHTSLISCSSDSR